MKNKNELNYKDLKMNCNPNIFNFDSTAELESIQEFSKEEKEVQCIRQKHTFSKWLNQGKTWFGMPANSILVIFGILL